jgi:drug/metabolite transporter (DMT)-like permease
LGILLALTAATSFGVLPILVKFAYAMGLQAVPLLAYRYLLSVPGFLAIAIVTRENPFRIRGRWLLMLFAMGALGLSGGSLALFTALRTLPASVTELIFFTYPVIVAAAGWLLFGRRISLRHLVALGASLCGVGLLIGSGLRGGTGTGIVFAAVAGLIFAAYLMAGEYVMSAVPKFGGMAVIICGAAFSWLIIGGLSGQLEAPPWGAWPVLGAIVLVPTVVGISSTLLALPLIGANRVAILDTWEPVVTVVLAIVILGDRLAASQVVGGTFVIGAVIWFQLRGSPIQAAPDAHP